MYIKRICLSIIIASASSVFAANTVTYFRDGTLIQRDATATKGIIDLPLAADLLDHSLTVVPASGTTILAVDTIKRDPVNSKDTELDALTEQRRKLEDRLQALEAREAIFTTAAKSQSGKAPRKTKTNPDPLQAIRQGTDFAIAQLEAVYTARRKATHEIQKIDARMAATRKSVRPASTSLRVRVSPANGRVTLRYATTERGWEPRYNLYLVKTGGTRLQLSARVTKTASGYQTRISSGSLIEQGSVESVPATAESAILASYRLPLTEEQHTEGIFNRFSGKITNNTSQYLPPGDSGLYRDGTYVGTFRFDGISSGRSRVVSLGK